MYVAARVGIALPLSGLSGMMCTRYCSQPRCPAGMGQTADGAHIGISVGATGLAIVELDTGHLLSFFDLWCIHGWGTTEEQLHIVLGGDTRVDNISADVARVADKTIAIWTTSGEEIVAALKSAATLLASQVSSRCLSPFVRAVSDRPHCSQSEQKQDSLDLGDIGLEMVDAGADHLEQIIPGMDIAQEPELLVPRQILSERADGLSRTLAGSPTSQIMAASTSEQWAADTSPQPEAQDSARGNSVDDGHEHFDGAETSDEGAPLALINLGMAECERLAPRRSYHATRTHRNGDRCRFGLRQHGGPSSCKWCRGSGCSTVATSDEHTALRVGSTSPHGEVDWSYCCHSQPCCRVEYGRRTTNRFRAILARIWQFRSFCQDMAADCVTGMAL
jgi:hypothetical protein